jgi:hypothetical protein
MANVKAVANGNWSNTATWDGGVLPTSSDDVYANNFTVTIDGTFTVLTIRTTSASGITAGGQFKFANGGSLTCTAGNAIEVGSTTPALLNDLGSGTNATFTGSIISLTNTTNYVAMSWTGAGTFNIVSNTNLNTLNVNGRRIFTCEGTGILNHVGNMSSSGTSAGGSNTYGVGIIGNCTYNHTGDNSGGAAAILTGTAAPLFIQANANYIQTGNNVAGATPCIVANTTCNIKTIGDNTGSATAPAINNTTTACTIELEGTTTSGSGYPAVTGLITTLVKVKGNVVHTNTYAAIYAGRVVIDDNVTSWQFKDSTNTVTRTLYTAGVNLGNPLESDVRDGVDYGASLELTGTLAVPDPSNVRKGVPTDDTVGTADLTAEDLLTAIEESTNDVAVRLRNVATNESVNEIVASYGV